MQTARLVPVAKTAQYQYGAVLSGGHESKGVGTSEIVTVIFPLAKELKNMNCWPRFGFERLVTEFPSKCSIYSAMDCCIYSMDSVFGLPSSHICLTPPSHYFYCPAAHLDKCS